jgi:hypothetical protein
MIPAKNWRYTRPVVIALHTIMHSAYRVAVSTPANVARLASASPYVLFVYVVNFFCKHGYFSPRFVVFERPVCLPYKFKSFMQHRLAPRLANPLLLGPVAQSANLLCGMRRRQSPSVWC